MSQFILIGDRVVNFDHIASIDFANVEELRIKLYPMYGQIIEVVGIQVIDILMAIKPSALESRRMRWHRHAWAFHNLIGHPLMQLLAFFKHYKLAMQVHDLTVPRPLGRRIPDLKRTKYG